jgi:hypothetical protein
VGWLRLDTRGSPAPARQAAVAATVGTNVRAATRRERSVATVNIPIANPIPLPGISAMPWPSMP